MLFVPYIVMSEVWHVVDFIKHQGHLIGVYQWPTTISLGYIKNGFCSDSRINMGILHQKLLYQFLDDPSYHQLIADIQKGIVAKCNSDLRRKIYPAFRKRITQQCSNSIQDYITPIHRILDINVIYIDVQYPISLRDVLLVLVVMMMMIIKHLIISSTLTFSYHQ